MSEIKIGAITLSKQMTIGDITLSEMMVCNGHKIIGMSYDSGEAMMVSEQSLYDLLKKFYEENF